MDGVLADFDRGYREEFGVPHGGKELDNVDWQLVKRHGSFYLNLPPMPDMYDLWMALAPLSPTLLSGVPATVPDAAKHKRLWVDLRLGGNVPLITCASKDKCLQGQPGDILIDDWEKYRHLWEGMGGRWITHTSAADTLRQLGHML